MRATDLARVREIFGRIIEAEPAERPVLLVRECADQPGLESRVLELLAAHERAGEFLSTPTIDGQHADHPNPILDPNLPLAEIGQRIGRYLLVAPLGEGGFGFVFLAEQEQPVRRQVALKIIKAGMDTQQVVARFEAERQTLAMMEHPNIARVFDGGATDSGRPYFVMELVRGEPITKYCDGKKLATRQRLELFVPVCRAVQHAHQKGIIHRDLKPSNVLVAVDDGVATPKVIDFGIAKASSGDSAGHTQMTEQRQFLGTPQYMSPEQAEGTAGGRNVDTRSDIYSLGVLLYELLAGVLPFDPKRLNEAPYDEVRRIIRGVDPQRPSTRLMARNTEAQISAALRSTEPSRLRTTLKGELDWIVMKALEKDPARRYDTASDLGAEIIRYLADEPVLAGPPGAAYRLGKLARRHRVALVTVALIVLSLAVGLTVASVEVVRAHHAERSEAAQHADAVNKLWSSYLAEARVSRYSGRAGQRFDGLKALSLAAQIKPTLEVRNEAIACLSVPDMELIKSWNGRAEGLEQMSFSPAMDRYARSDAAGNIQIRAVADDRQLMSLPGYGVPLDWSLNFSPDGRYLAAVYSKGPSGFHVWDLRSGKSVLALADPVAPERAVDFAPDSRSIAVAAPGQVIALYSLPAGQKIMAIDPGGAAERLRFDPGGQRLAASMQRKIVILDGKSGHAQIAFNAPAAVERLSWDAQGSALAGSCRDRNIYVWDTNTGEQRAAMDGHLSVALRAEFLHSNHLLLSGSWDYTARLWDARTGRQLLLARSPGYSMQLSADDRLAGLCSGSLGYLWRIEPGEECRTFSGPPGDERGWCADFSPDARTIAGASRGGVRIWNLASGRELAHIPARSTGPMTAFFAPDGRTLLSSGEHGVQAWPTPIDASTASGSASSEPEQIAPANGVAAMSADGHTLVFEAGAGQLFVKGLAGDAGAFPLGTHAGGLRCIAVSPDGLWAATGVRRGTFRVWDVAQRRLAAEFTSSSADLDMQGVAFTPDSRYVVGGDAGSYRFWETGSWKLHHRIPRVLSPMPALVAFTADGSVMAAITTDADTVQLLDPMTGAQFASFEDPQMHELAGLCLSRDGAWLAAANQDHTTTVWNVRLIRQKLAFMKLDW